MSIDYKELETKLREGFIYREYQVINPEMHASYFEAAIIKYRTDPYFRARVTNVVANVCEIVRRVEVDDEQ